jgi:hypothetical protein
MLPNEELGWMEWCHAFYSIEILKASKVVFHNFHPFDTPHCIVVIVVVSRSFGKLWSTTQTTVTPQTNVSKVLTRSFEFLTEQLHNRVRVSTSSWLSFFVNRARIWLVASPFLEGTSWIPWNSLTDWILRMPWNQSGNEKTSIFGLESP